MDTSGLLIGDLVFITSGWDDLTGDLIRLGESIQDHNDSFKHVAIYIGDNKVAEAPGNRPTGESPMYQEYTIGRVDLTDEQRQKVADEARKEFGKPYDWKYIEEIGLHILLGLEEPTEADKSKCICTTYVMSVFKNAVDIDFDCGVTPVELSQSSRITLVKL